jgi:hypothetical protein
VPEAARANTPEGATEFAKFFITAVSEANVDLDSSAIRTLSLPACQTCEGAIEGVQKYKAAGQRERESRYTPSSSQVGPAGDGSYAVDVLGSYSESAVIDGKGNVVQALPAADSALRVTVNRVGDGWRVREVAVIER